MHAFPPCLAVLATDLRLICDPPPQDLEHFDHPPQEDQLQCTEKINEHFFTLRLYHSNDSHQCPILAADFVIFYYGIENEEAIQAGARSE